MAYEDLFSRSKGNASPPRTLLEAVQQPPPYDRPSVGGFFSNVGEGIGDIVGGITGLLKAGVNDLYGLGKEAVTLGQAETDYMLDDVALQMLPALWDDLKTRYGPLVTGDLPGFARQLYEEPVAFGLDAAAVAGAAAVGARALPAGSAVRQAIRGPGEAARVLGSTTSTVRRSYNPLVRAMQNKAFEWASEPVDVVKKRIEFATAKLGPDPSVAAELYGASPGIRDRILGKTQLVLPDQLGDVGAVRSAAAEVKSAIQSQAIAEATGDATKAVTRLYKPTVGNILKGRLGNKLMGGYMNRFIYRRDIPIEKLKQVFRVWEDQGVTAEALLEKIQGSRKMVPSGPDFTPDEPLGQGPIDIPSATMGQLEVDQLTFGPVTSRANFSQPNLVLSMLEDKFGGGNAHIHDVGPPHIDETAYGPRRLEAGRPNPDRPSSYHIDSPLEEAEKTLFDAADAMGGELLGIKNYFADEFDPWNGVNGIIRTTDGALHDVSVGPPALREAQEVVGEILKRHRSVLEQRATIGSMLAEFTDDVKKLEEARAEISMLDAEAEAAQRVTRGIFEGPIRSYRTANEGIPYDPAQAAADQFRTIVFKHITLPEVEHGLTFTEIMNRSYGPTRLTFYKRLMALVERDLNDVVSDVMGASRINRPEEIFQAVSVYLEHFRLGGQQLFDPSFVGSAAGRALDPGVVRKANPAFTAGAIFKRLNREVREAFVIDGSAPGFGWRTMDDYFKNAGFAQPFYYPHIAIDKARLSQYLGGAGRIENINGREISNVSKQWGGWLFEQGRMITDPVEAYGRIAATVARHQEMIRLMEELKKSGLVRKVNWGIEEAEWRRGLNKSEKLWNPEAFKAHMRQRMNLVLDTSDGLLAGDTLEQATADALRSLQFDALRDVLDEVSGDLYAIPRAVADRLERTIKVYLGWKARLFYDGAMNVWRAAVLSLSPRWIVNNVIGNLVFTAIKDPRAIPMAMRQMLPKYREMARAVFGEEILQEIERGFFFKGTQRATELGEVKLRAPRAAAIMERGKETLVAKVSQKARSINSYIEDAFRRGIFLSEMERKLIQGTAGKFKKDVALLQRVAKDGVTEKLVDDALTAVNATLGDYAALGPLERQVLRRFFVPFWPFYKHATKFIAKLPVEHPMKAATLRIVDQIDEEMMGEVPPWLMSSVPIQTLGPQGDLFFRLGNANPLQGLIQAPTSVLSTLAPIPKIAFERLAGVSGYTGRPFSSEQVLESSGGTKWEIIRGPDGAVIAVEPVYGKVLPSWWRHLAQNFPQWQLLEDLAAAFIGPGTGAQYSATGNVIVEGGVPKYPTPAWTYLADYFGLPVDVFDIEKFRYDQMKEEFEALKRAMKQE